MSMFLLVSLGFISLTLVETCLVALMQRFQCFRDGKSPPMVETPMAVHDDHHIYSLEEDGMRRFIIDILNARSSVERGNHRSRRGDYIDTVFILVLFLAYISFLMLHVFS